MLRERHRLSEEPFSESRRFRGVRPLSWPAALQGGRPGGVLHVICRAVGVGMKWLMAFLVECYEAAPAHLNVQLRQPPDPLLVGPLEAEADELWSFIGKKANPQWLWLALDAQNRQVLAFHVGNRSRKSARQLWNQLPAVYRKQATIHTDAYAAYGRVIPQAQHRVITKEARNTNPVERFNGTLRQRLSRLVRSA